MRLSGFAYFIIKIIRLFPPMLFITLGVVYAVLSVFQQYDLLIRGTYMILPIIFLNVVYFMKLRYEKNELDFHIRYLAVKPKMFFLFAVLFITLQIFGVASSILIGRSVIYFICTVIGILIVAIQILASGQRRKSNVIIVILEIICLYLNIVFCQNLELPLYFGTTDPLIHMSFMQSVIDRHSITSAMGDYEMVPLNHIFGAVVVLVSGLDLETSIFIYYSIAFASTILLVYLFSYRVTNNNQIAQITTLLYALNAEIIFAGLGVTTRVISFAQLLLLLYLVVDRPKKIKRALSLLVILPLILTHHTTLIQFWVLLVIIMFIEMLILGRITIFRLGYIILISVCFIGYWIYTSDFVFVKLINVFVNISELSTLPDVTSIAKPLNDSFFGTIDQSIVAFFSLLGISVIANTSKRDIVLIISIFSLIGLLFYLDTPFEYLAYLLLTSRLPLIVAPFVMISMAFGIYYFVSNKVVNLAFYAVTLISFGLSSILIQGNSTDLNLSPTLSRNNRQYFIDSEIAALEHISYFLEGGERVSVVFSDWQASRYLQAHSNDSTTSIIEWPSIADSGYYFLYRVKELTEKKQIKFTKLPSGSPRTIGVLETKNDIDNWFSPTSIDVLYSSETCILQYINK